MSVRQEVATVVETYNRKAKVKIKRSSECEHCKAAKFCGMLSRPYILIEADNPVQAKQGEEVLVKIEVEDELKAAFLLYFIPLVAFMLGMLLGSWVHLFGNPNLSMCFFSFLFLGISFIGIKLYNDRIYKQRSFSTPVITKVLHKT
jgi:sigma-E factor negative regulatory protein RseC